MRTINSKKSNFVFSSMTDNRVEKDILSICWDLSQISNKESKISKYTDKFQQIALTFMAINPQTHSFRPDKKFWRWKAKNFDMYMNVPDYEAFCKADKNGAKKIVAELYLKAIEKYLSKQKDFKHKLFYKDTKELFEKEGIL